ncbi:MAG TPA: hypothetical protein PLX89_11650 [Verrucomicrobiota bacterium]|nr:hypothetical protein [Verrucomicrobiota bacterium]
MQAVRKPEIRRNSFDGAQGMNCVLLPPFPTRKDVRPQGYAELLGFRFNSLHVFRPYVNGLMEDRDWVDLRDSGQGRPEVVFVTLRVGWGNRRKDM